MRKKQFEDGSGTVVFGDEDSRLYDFGADYPDWVVSQAVHEAHEICSFQTVQHARCGLTFKFVAEADGDCRQYNISCDRSACPQQTGYSYDYAAGYAEQPVTEALDDIQRRVISLGGSVTPPTSV